MGAVIMKLLSAIVGYLGVQAGKEEDDAQCARAMTFPGYENCRCSDVFWKGGKQSRVTYQDSTSAMFMSSIPDNAGSWRFRDESHAAFDPNYSIILQFVRKNCGVSFLAEVAEPSREILSRKRLFCQRQRPGQENGNRNRSRILWKYSSIHAAIAYRPKNARRYSVRRQKRRRCREEGPSLGLCDRPRDCHLHRRPKRCLSSRCHGWSDARQR